MEHVKNIINQSKKLIKAATIGDNEGIISAIKSKASVNYKGNKAVKIAAFYGHLETVKILIANGANSNADLDWHVIYYPSKNGKTTFHREKNPWEWMDYQECALTMALKDEHYDIVDFLIDYSDAESITKNQSHFKKCYNLLIKAVEQHNLNIDDIFDHIYYDNTIRTNMIEAVKNHYGENNTLIPDRVWLLHYMNLGDCKRLCLYLTIDASTTIYFAFMQPHLHVLRFIVQHFKATLDSNHIYLAIERGQIEFLRFTLGLVPVSTLSFDNRHEERHFIERIVKKPCAFLELLVENGFSLNEERVELIRLCACNEGNIAVIQYLMNRGLALRDESIVNACTPEMIDFLMKQGLNIHANRNIIIEHATEGHRDIVHKYLDNGITHPNLLSTISSWYSYKDLLVKAMKFTYDVSEYNQTLVHCAHRDFHFTRQLIDQKGADVNYVDINGRTPLLSAIRRKGKIGIINYLMSKGAKVDAHTWRTACESRRLDVVKLLLQKGIKPPKDIIISAFTGGNIDIIMLFNTNHIHTKKNAIILTVAQHGHVEIMQYLIERGDFVSSYDIAFAKAKSYNQNTIQQMLTGALANNDKVN